MRRGRIFIFLALIAIVVLVVVFVLVRQLGASSGPQAVPTPSMVEILVAAQSIPQGQPITAEALTTFGIPPDKVNAVMFRADQINDVVGKLARYPIEPGVPITSALIGDSTPEAAGPEWMRLISPGMTAMSIPISRLTSAAYAVQDGAHVNVIACLLAVDVDTSYQTILPNMTLQVYGTGTDKATELPILTVSPRDFGGSQGRVELDASLQMPVYVLPSEAQRPRLVCQLLLQDVVVLRLGDFPLPDRNTTATVSVVDPAAATPPPDTTTTATSLPPDIITLIVNPADSLALSHLIFDKAQLILTLRNSSDQSRVATESMTLAYLLNQYGISLPAKLPYGLQPRIDILEQPVMRNDVLSVPGN
jgi:hypothetical protein